MSIEDFFPVSWSCNLNFNKYLFSGFGPVFPPFMQNMTSDQIRGYFDIIQSNNISMNQQTQQLNDWASQNGVSVRLHKFLDLLYF